MGGITKMKALKKGFTLIELIVVIAILAILALLIVPQVTGYVTKANEAVAKANARSCYTEWAAGQTALESGVYTEAPDLSSGCKASEGLSLTTDGTITWNANGEMGSKYAGIVTVTKGLNAAPTATAAPIK